MMMDETREAADQFHTETPGNTVWAAASTAMPTADPNWDVMLRIGPKLKTIKTVFSRNCEEGCKTQKDLVKYRKRNRN